MIKKFIYLFFILLLMCLLVSFGENPQNSAAAVPDNGGLEDIWLYKKAGMNLYIEFIQYKNGLFRLKDNKGIVDRKASWKYDPAYPGIIFITADVAEDIAYWEKIYFNESTQTYLKANAAYFNLEEKTVGIKIQQDQEGKDFIIFMNSAFYRVEGD